MTATEMYNQFMLEINAAASASVKATDVQSWLNTASINIYNDRLYNYKQKGGVNQSPPNAAEDSKSNIFTLAPFERTITTNTASGGFVTIPDNCNYILAVYANKPEDSCNLAGNLIPVKLMRKQEIAAFSQNVFKKPEWGDASVPCERRYQPYYTTEVTTDKAEGIQIWPNKAGISITIIYYKNPTPIIIKTPPIDLQYAGSPNLIVYNSDVNSEFPEASHMEIVRRGVELYNISKRDLNDAQINRQLINTQNG
jgi:hypothetical protein